jgi:hypothetical protein
MSAATSFGTEMSASQTVLAKSARVTGEIYCNESLTIKGEVNGRVDVTGHLLTIRVAGKIFAPASEPERSTCSDRFKAMSEEAEKIYVRNGTFRSSRDHQPSALPLQA